MRHSGGRAPEELYSTDNRSTADGLQGLPRDYTGVPQLGPPLPGDLADEILGLWDEYSGGATPEAQMVKGFDKLETMLQHLLGRNAPDFDYRFNLGYGAQHTAKHPLLAQMRGMVDAATRERIALLDNQEAGA